MTPGMLHNPASPMTSAITNKKVCKMTEDSTSKYLVIVVVTMEERLFSEDHACQHTAQTPHVQAIVIHLKNTNTQREY